MTSAVHAGTALARSSANGMLVLVPKPLVQPPGEPHFGLHAAFVTQPDMPAVINKNRPGDFRGVKWREVAERLEYLAQCGVRRLVLAGPADDFRRNLVNRYESLPQHTRLAEHNAELFWKRSRAVAKPQPAHKIKTEVVVVGCYAFATNCRRT